MEIGKKMICGLKKTKYMVINTHSEHGKGTRRSNRRKSKRKNSSRNRYLQVPRNGIQ